jgi:hypothetical protein
MSSDRVRMDTHSALLPSCPTSARLVVDDLVVDERASLRIVESHLHLRLIMCGHPLCSAPALHHVHSAASMTAQCRARPFASRGVGAARQVVDDLVNDERGSLRIAEPRLHLSSPHVRMDIRSAPLCSAPTAQRVSSSASMTSSSTSADLREPWNHICSCRLIACGSPLCSAPAVHHVRSTASMTCSKPSTALCEL